MQRTVVLTLLLFAPAGAMQDSEAEKIVALERAALDRWGKGDPQGYLEAYAVDVTYFDPAQAARVDGLRAMRELLEPIAGKLKIDRYEMLGTKVQRRGDTAILTYNLVSHATRPDGAPFTVRWNSTAVYGRIAGKWKIIHSHWSYTKPQLKVMASEQR